jgi:hypothetical protein
VYFARNARCTVPTITNTQNDFSHGAAIFSLHTLASPSGRNVNYDEKQLTGKKVLSFTFYLYRFRKYVSYGFPTINFCNPEVHYETPCILGQRPVQYYQLMTKCNYVNCSQMMLMLWVPEIFVWCQFRTHRRINTWYAEKLNDPVLSRTIRIKIITKSKCL